MLDSPCGAAEALPKFHLFKNRNYAQISKMYLLKSDRPRRTAEALPKFQISPFQKLRNFAQTSKTYLLKLDSPCGAAEALPKFQISPLQKLRNVQISKMYLLMLVSPCSAAEALPKFQISPFQKLRNFPNFKNVFIKVRQPMWCSGSSAKISPFQKLRNYVQISIMYLLKLDSPCDVAEAMPKFQIQPLQNLEILSKFQSTNSRKRKTNDNIHQNIENLSKQRKLNTVTSYFSQITINP